VLPGIIVRQKAKDITALLSDESRLKEERRSRNAMRDRMGGRGDHHEGHTPVYEGPGVGDDDRDLQRALEESRRMAHNGGGRSRYVMQSKLFYHECKKSAHKVLCEDVKKKLTLSSLPLCAGK